MATDAPLPPPRVTVLAAVDDGEVQLLRTDAGQLVLSVAVDAQGDAVGHEVSVNDLRALLAAVGAGDGLPEAVRAFLAEQEERAEALFAARDASTDHARALRLEQAANEILTVVRGVRARATPPAPPEDVRAAIEQVRLVSDVARFNGASHAYVARDVLETLAGAASSLREPGAEAPAGSRDVLLPAGVWRRACEAARPTKDAADWSAVLAAATSAYRDGLAAGTGGRRDDPQATAARITARFEEGLAFAPPEEFATRVAKMRDEIAVALAAPPSPEGGGLPEDVRQQAMLAASSTRRSLDENIAAAAEVAYAAGLAAAVPGGGLDREAREAIALVLQGTTHLCPKVRTGLERESRPAVPPKCRICDALAALAPLLTGGGA